MKFVSLLFMLFLSILALAEQPKPIIPNRQRISPGFHYDESGKIKVALYPLPKNLDTFSVSDKMVRDIAQMNAGGYFVVLTHEDGNRQTMLETDAKIFKIQRLFQQESAPVHYYDTGDSELIKETLAEKLTERFGEYRNVEIDWTNSRMFSGRIWVPVFNSLITLPDKGMVLRQNPKTPDLGECFRITSLLGILSH